MFSLLLTVLPFSFLFLYGRWLYHNRQDINSSLVPIWLSALGLLLAALYQSQVFSQALLEQYSLEVSWLSGLPPYASKLADEGMPLLVLGSIGGFVFLIFFGPRDRVQTQAKHFLLLLLFLYPFLALLALSEVGATRPTIGYTQPLPGAGTRMPTRRDPPPARAGSERAVPLPRQGPI
ncbi:hypothetical protein [Hymenobacter volaticus]|uniref:Uncharacterized protein n=1 Tax=Hymenobacter volaticus TaxID=2932254 RepID=A0ABY4GE08_9BACT|nr:hypothetical protein [Hymenobacter volaticus]UOQ69160.1 hypothetical protein MUN86_25950 [Hymenobacter volaticus]